MSDKQQRRAQILERLAAGSMTALQAAGLLQISVRQVGTLKKRYAAEGMAACVHGNRGRAPANKTDAATVAQVRELAGRAGLYAEYNICHLAETLERKHAILLPRSTLDRLLIGSGARSRKKPQPITKRRRRTRMPAEGDMLQIDGSEFAWLCGDKRHYCLLGAVDDATGKILYLHLRPTEDQAGYLMLLRAVACSHGVPASYYHDKHTILRSPKHATLEDELAGTQPQSQVQHVLSLLGCESIAAHSPQAKGRIERLWKTLQDRLKKELATEKVSTLEAANAFLPDFIARYNAVFAHPPADPDGAWEPLANHCDLDYYFAAREARSVRNDHTITWQNTILQIHRKPKDPNLAQQKVNVHTLPDGTLALYVGKRRLDHQKLDARPVQEPAVKPPQAKPQSQEQQRISRRKQMAHLHTHAG